MSVIQLHIFEKEIPEIDFQLDRGESVAIYGDKCKKLFRIISGQEFIKNGSYILNNTIIEAKNRMYCFTKEIAYVPTDYRFQIDATVEDYFVMSGIFDRNQEREKIWDQLKTVKDYLDINVPLFRKVIELTEKEWLEIMLLQAYLSKVTVVCISSLFEEMNHQEKENYFQKICQMTEDGFSFVFCDKEQNVVDFCSKSIHVGNVREVV